MKIIRAIAIIMLFFEALLFFAPKEKLYYWLETKLQKHDMIVSDEVLTEKSFGLIAEKSNLYLDGVLIANIERATLQMFGFYNTLELEATHLSNGSVSAIIPDIDALRVTYHILQPNKFLLKGFIQKSEIQGYYELSTKKIFITFSAESPLGTHKLLSKNLTLKDGTYIYEYTFAAQ